MPSAKTLLIAAFISTYLFQEISLQHFISGILNNADMELGDMV